MTNVSYTLGAQDARTHLFDLRCQVQRPDPSGQRVSLPAWIPGSYLVRDFAKHLTMGAVRTVSGRELTLTRLDKQTWECEAVDESIVLEYQVYARDNSVRAAYLDSRRGFVNATSVFLRVHGQEQQPHRVTVSLPGEGSDGHWRVTTPLTPADVDSSGWGSYEAEHYAELVDSPILMSDFDSLSFTVDGAPHDMLLEGHQKADKNRIAEDLSRICAAHARMMGQLPVNHYSFLTFVVARGYGGLEHRNCSVLQVARDSLPPVRGQPGSGYMDFLGLCSHEYFHLWNVKRIRAQAVAQSNLDREAHFADLWAYEGITSYYDELALARSGLLQPDAYLQRLADAATRMQRNPGRRYQTLADSSYDAWTKFYKQDENTLNAVVSYYNKGSFVALCLDLRLRLLNRGFESLDGVMRQLWQAYGVSETPVPEHGLETLVLDALDGPERRDMQTFFSRFVHDTEDMDEELQTLLGEFGVAAQLDRDRSDAGVLAGAGLRVAAGAGGDARIATVLRNSPAERAGLSPEDIIVAVAGQRVNASGLAGELRKAEMDGEFAIHFFRDDRLLACQYETGDQIAEKWHFRMSENVSDIQAQRRGEWLGQTC